MEGNRRWFIPVRRRIVSAVLSVTAVFVIFGSWGMGSGRWLSFGIALLAAGIGLAVISAMTSTIRGTAHVLAVNEPPTVKHFGRCSLSVIVNAKNTEPIFIKLLEDDVPLDKWPHVRDDLPVSVAASDARVITVLWDEVRPHAKAGAKRRQVEAREKARREREKAAARSEDARSEDARSEDAREVEAVEPSAAAAAPAAQVAYAAPTPEPDLVDTNGDATTPARPTVVDLDPSEYSVSAYSVSAGDTASTRASAMITGSKPRRRPSPRPRKPVEDKAAEGAAASATSLDLSETGPRLAQSVPGYGAPAQATAPDAHPGGDTPTGQNAVTEPIHVGHVGVMSPAIPAPDEDTPYDQEAGFVDAYRAAAPPPGADRARNGITVTLLISDLSRSIVFYRDVLGFREVDAGRGTAVLGFGDARLLLRVVKGAQPTQRLVQMLLEVPDVDVTHEDLRARGITFLHRPRRIGQYEQVELRAAAFRDPDGHGIAIAQWRDI